MNSDLFSSLINKTILDVVSELKASDSISITKNIPIEKLSTQLPEEIRLCRIFALKANTKSKIERHPNSIQRTFTYFGEGDTKILENNVWKSNIRTSSTNDRWLSVPKNTWHQPISLSSDWVTITFHTALESEIIDEYKT